MSTASNKSVEDGASFGRRSPLFDMHEETSIIVDASSERSRSVEKFKDTESILYSSNREHAQTEGGYAIKESKYNYRFGPVTTTNKFDSDSAEAVDDLKPLAACYAPNQVSAVKYSNTISVAHRRFTHHLKVFIRSICTCVRRM